MLLPVDRLRVEITTKACEIPMDERERLQRALATLADAASVFPDPVLWLEVIYHAPGKIYHVESKLQLPGRTIITGEKDPYLDSALQRCIQRVIRKMEAYKDHPDQQAVAAAERLDALDREIVAPEAPDAGPLAHTAETGNYRAFRAAMAIYEEWLRKRVGRLIQRIPEAQARLGEDLHLGDIVEEVYLNAFEQFTRRPTAVPLSEWLEGLIERSIRALLRHPEGEAEAASLARTLRETPLT